MAEYSFSRDDAGYVADTQPDYSVAQASSAFGNVVNVAGAVMSLALVIGIGVWGYKLLVRDVTGIPVVKAASGEMRVEPANPGGELAQHQGLSVNAVAAVGTAARPADQLKLAPKPVDLTDEDIVQPQAIVAAEAIEDDAPLAEPVVDAEEIASALQSGEVDDLVAKLTEGVAPLEELQLEPEEVVPAVTEAVVAEVRAAEAQVAAVLDAPGVRNSLRPRKRPAALATVVQTAAVAAPAAEVDLDPASLPAGTRLAQLGAFDSAEVAREQWDQMQNRFGDYMRDKKRVVQKATSGGRVFYRLRAHGFADIGEARRFCSALVAENADCIPVVTR